jgi:hypothetical protein
MEHYPYIIAWHGVKRKTPPINFGGASLTVARI